LEENNISISYIAGSSIGAMIGGLYASGLEIGEIEKFL
jgi:NTE family protein